jgi:hypothetical protein
LERQAAGVWTGFDDMNNSSNNLVSPSERLDVADQVCVVKYVVETDEDPKW